MALFSPLRDRLNRFVYSLCRDKDRAHDIVSETVLLAYQQFEKLRAKEAFLSYLFTIARRVWLAQIRRGKKFSDIGESDWDFVMDNNTAPDMALDIQNLYKALDKLPDHVREAVVMFELLGFSMKEIQDVQGGNLIAVKVRISRGRKKLAKLLGVHHYQKQVQKKKTRSEELDEESGKFDYSELTMERAFA